MAEKARPWAKLFTVAHFRYLLTQCIYHKKDLKFWTPEGIKDRLYEIFEFFKRKEIISELRPALKRDTPHRALKEKMLYQLSKLQDP